MKYIQSGGGYCYKQYKNGKKVRISKKEYNKKKWKLYKYKPQYEYLTDDVYFDYENQLAEQFISVLKK